MTNSKLAMAYIALFLLITLSFSCNKPDDIKSDPDVHVGVLYYSSADKLIRFDFNTHQETMIFSDGNDYSISPDGQQFAWYKNDFGEGSTTIQLHTMQTPSDYKSISIPYILENTPEFIQGEDLLGALARSKEDPDSRKDLLLFNYQGEIIGRIPHVKDFVFSPDGKDLIISAEAINTDNGSKGYALALLKNYRSKTSQQSITIREFTDYNLLPVDMAVSPNSSMVAYTHLDHLYTIPLKEGSNHTQITESRFKEADVNWSPDNNYLIFTANIVDNGDCGEIRIIPSQPESIIRVPEDGYDNAPADPLQPVNNNGKVIHSCGSENIFWQQ